MNKRTCWLFLCLGIVLLLTGQEPPVNQDQGFGVGVQGEVTVGPIVGPLPAPLPITPGGLGIWTIPKGWPNKCKEKVSFSYWQGRYNPTLQDQVLLDLINNLRQTSGHSPLNWHTGLAKAAIDHVGWCGSCGTSIGATRTCPGPGSPADAPDPLDLQEFCICGFSNIYNDLNFNDCNCEPPHTLDQEFVTSGPSNNPAAPTTLFCFGSGALDCPCVPFPQCSPAINCELWDIPGRLQNAMPQITFNDLGVIIAQQQGAGVSGDAGSFFYSGIVGDPFAANLVTNPAFTTIGSSFDPCMGTWVVVVGSGISP